MSDNLSISIIFSLLYFIYLSGYFIVISTSLRFAQYYVTRIEISPRASLGRNDIKIHIYLLATKKRAVNCYSLFHWNRRRPTLPGRVQPSTLSAGRLNFCVRNENRWIPTAIITGMAKCSLHTHNCTVFSSSKYSKKPTSLTRSV